MVERYSKPRDVATIQFAVIGTRTSRSPALALVLPEKAIPPAVRSGIDQALQVAQTSPADVARSANSLDSMAS